jgi:hypothetical protein
MTVEADILAALQTVAARVYPDEAEAGCDLPYIVYTQVGGPSPTYVERTVPNLKGARIQVNAWARTRVEAASLGLQIEVAMVQSTAFDAKPIGAHTATLDPETKYRGTRQDFSVWSAR